MKLHPVLTALLCSLAIFAALPESAMARVDVDINIGLAPPMPRMEVVPPPRMGYVWAPGYWSWDGGTYIWIGGRWIPERPGYYWRPERWEPRERHYHFAPGGWERHHERRYERREHEYERHRHER